MKLILFVCVLLLIFTSCKKTVPYYGVSDELKEYFVFQKGSYWIYKNDTTGLLDSTIVSSNISFIDDKGYPGIKRELIVLSFKSQFLNEFEIGYICEGPDYLMVSANSNNPNTGPLGGGVAYYGGWPVNTEIVSPQCEPGIVFSYRMIDSIKINNLTYRNIIISKSISVDSTINNAHFVEVEIYFVINIGIVKYFDISKDLNIQRSYSILRHKVIQ